MATLRIILFIAEEAVLPDTPRRASFGIETLPSVAGSSPATMSRKVVLPEPLAPTRP